MKPETKCIRCSLELAHYPGGTHGRCSLCEAKAKKEIEQLRKEGYRIEDQLTSLSRHGERCGNCAHGVRDINGLFCYLFRKPVRPADTPAEPGCWADPTRNQAVTFCEQCKKTSRPVKRIKMCRDCRDEALSEMGIFE